MNHKQEFLVTMRFEIQEKMGPGEHALFLIGTDRLGNKARIEVDFFGDTPIEKFDGETIALQCVARKIDAAKLKLLKALL